MSNGNVLCWVETRTSTGSEGYQQSVGSKTNNQLLVRLSEFIGVVLVAIDGLPFLYVGKSQACKLIGK